MTDYYTLAILDELETQAKRPGARNIMVPASNLRAIIHDLRGLLALRRYDAITGDAANTPPLEADDAFQLKFT